MKTFRFALFLAVAVMLARAGARAADFSPASVGAGPHGYDWLLGSWSCTNSISSPMGGPAETKVTAATAPGNSIAFHITGKGFDSSGYLKFLTKTKTWWNPMSYMNGGNSLQSSSETGHSVMFIGSYFDPASDGTLQTRDTYTVSSATKFNDLSEARDRTGWKHQANITCTKDS